MRSTLPYSASVFLHVCLLGAIVGWIAADQSPVGVQIGGGGGDGLTPGAAGGGSDVDVVRFDLGAARLGASQASALRATPARSEEPAPQPVGVDTRPDRTSSDVANTERSAAKAVQIETPEIQPLDLAVDGPALPIRVTQAPVRRTEISDQPDSDQMRSAHLLRRSGAASIAMSLGTATVTVDEGILDGNGVRSIGGKGPGGGSGEGPGAGSGAGSGRGSGGGSGGGAASLPSAGPGNPLPIYPPDALAAGAEGRAVLRVSIRADGSVESLTVENTAGWKSLDDSALETVRTWRFIPARRNDRPVASVVLVPVRFRMLGGPGPP